MTDNADQTTQPEAAPQDQTDEAATDDEISFDDAFAQFSRDDPTKEDTAAAPSEASRDGTSSQSESADAAQDHTSQAGEQAQATGQDAAQAPGGQQPDPFADATEAQRAAYQAALRDAEHARRSNAGRIRAMQQQIEELRQAQGQGQGQATDPQEQTASQGQQPADGQQTASAGTLAQDPNWQRFQQEYPEVAGPIASAIQGLETRNQTLERQLGQVTGRLSEEDTAAEAERLQEQHPDYGTVAADPRFREWYENQPPGVRQMVERNADAIQDADEAAVVLSLFKQSAGISQQQPQQPQPAAQAGASQAQPAAQPAQQPQQQQQSARRQAQLAGAQSVSAKSGAAASGPPDDFEAAFQHYARQESGR